MFTAFKKKKRHDPKVSKEVRLVVSESVYTLLANLYAGFQRELPSASSTVHVKRSCAN